MPAKTRTANKRTRAMDCAASVGDTYYTIYLTVEDNALDELQISIPDIDLVLVLHRDDMPWPFAEPDPCYDRRTNNEHLYVLERRVSQIGQAAHGHDDARLAEMDRRIDALEKRCATIERRQEEDAETFGQHARRLDAHYDGLAALEQRLDALKIGHNRLASRVSPVNDRLRALEAGLAGATDIATHAARQVNNLRRRLSLLTIGTRLDTLEAHAIETDDTLSVLSGRIDNDATALVERLAALEATHATP